MIKVPNCREKSASSNAIFGAPGSPNGLARAAHTVWEHTQLPERLTLSGDDGDDVLPYQEKAVRALLDALRRRSDERGANHDRPR